MKKMLETLFGWGLNSSRANKLSKINPGSGRLGGLMVSGRIVRAYSVLAAPSEGRVGLLWEPSALRYAYFSPTCLDYLSPSHDSRVCRHCAMLPDTYANGG